MPIKQKALIIILIINVATFIVVYLLLSVFISNNFRQVEDDIARSDLKKIQQLFLSKLSTLEVKVRDYAIWDDAYVFVQNKDAEFIAANYRTEIFENLGLSYMIFFDTNGKVVYGKYYSLETRSLEDLPEGVSKEVTDALFMSSKISSTGFITLSNKPNYFALHEILTSLGSGPSKGYLAFIRSMDDADVQDIRNITGFDLKTAAVYGLSNDQKAIAQKIKFGTGYDISYSKNYIEIKGVVSDVKNEPILLLTLTEYRDIYSKAKQMINSLWFIYMLIAIWSLLMWDYFSNKLIFKRIKNLDKQVYQMRLEKSFEHKLKVDGKDEISTLAQTINELLNNLSISETNYLKANTSLKNKAAELQKKTEELEKLNQYMVGREVRMSQLKKEIEELKSKFDQSNGK